MKKKLMKLLSLAAMLVMVFTLAACGSDDDKQEDSKKEAETKYAYKNMEEFVDSDEFKKEVGDELSSLETDELGIKITGKDNVLVYTYTYKTVEFTEEQIAELAKSFDEAMEETGNQFTSLLTVFEGKVENPVVRLEYIDKAGNLVYTKDFK